MGPKAIHSVHLCYYDRCRWCANKPGAAPRHIATNHAIARHVLSLHNPAQHAVIAVIQRKAGAHALLQSALHHTSGWRQGKCRSTCNFSKDESMLWFFYILKSLFGSHVPKVRMIERSRCVRIP